MENSNQPLAWNEFFDFEYWTYKQTYKEENLKPPSLFHYTSMQGFMGICASKSLWATDFKELNDPLEYVHGVKFVRNILVEKLDNEQDSFPKKVLTELLRVKFSEMLINNPEHSEWSNNIHFVVSLSEEKDLLSQWIYYGDKGRGLSLEINYDKELVTPPEMYPSGGTWYLQKIIYDKESKTGIINTIINMAFEEYKENKTNVEDFIDRLARALTLASQRFKQEGFSQEKEWRVYRTYRGFSHHRFMYNSITKEPEYRFRAVSDSIILYYEFPIESIGLTVIGPLQRTGSANIERIKFDGKCLFPERLDGDSVQKSKILLRG